MRVLVATNRPTVCVQPPAVCHHHPCSPAVLPAKACLLPHCSDVPVGRPTSAGVGFLLYASSEVLMSSGFWPVTIFVYPINTTLRKTDRGAKHSQSC